MFFFVELKKNSSLVKNVFAVDLSSPKEMAKLKNLRGMLVEDEECKEAPGKELLCVVNTSQGGEEIEVRAFTEAYAGEEYFKKIAARKFSNWEEYSAEGIESVLSDGYESNGDGSLCLSWVVTHEGNIYQSAK